MKEAADQLFRTLHREYFKLKGFKKVRNRFKRERDGAIEIIDFQGSAYNSRGEPWTFYVNIGLGFSTLPSTAGVGLHKEAYGTGRLGQVVKNAPSSFSYQESERDRLLTTIPPLIDLALVELQIHRKIVYERALKGIRSSMPIPKTGP